MPLRRVHTPVEQLQPFERCRIVGQPQVGWTNRRTATHVGYNVSVVCRCYQKWAVEHSHIRRPGSGRPRGTDARQDRRIVRAVVTARTASKEETRAHAAPAVSPRAIIGNLPLAAVLRSSVPLAGYHIHHDTSKRCYSGVVKEPTGEWNGALLSSVMRVGSVYTRVIDVHVYGTDLVSVIYWSAFAHDIQAPSQASWCGGLQ